MADKEKVKEQYKSDKHLHYHESQFREPKRSTIAMRDFIRRVLPSTQNAYSAIDVCCGGGGNIYHLSKDLPNTTWVGLDYADKFFTIAKHYLKENNKYQFIKGDLYKLRESFPAKSFDISFSLQTITWLPGYEEAMRELMAITKKWLFITSLFSDFKVDIFSNVVEYHDDWSSMEDSPYNYNIYSLGKFKHFCMQCGAKELIVEDFIIDIDIPVPANGQMGTYTIKDITGSRLSFSGPMFMPWKMIAIRME